MGRRPLWPAWVSAKRTPRTRGRRRLYRDRSPRASHRPSGNLRTVAARGRGKKHAFGKHLLCAKDSTCVISSSLGTGPGFTTSPLTFRFKVAQLLRPEARCLKPGPCTFHIAHSPLPFPENH